jgi:hypothetical protein
VPAVPPVALQVILYTRLVTEGAGVVTVKTSAAYGSQVPVTGGLSAELIGTIRLSTVLVSIVPDFGARTLEAGVLVPAGIKVGETILPARSVEVSETEYVPSGIALSGETE